MVQMAKPWKHPDTGVYHLYRQIPAHLREEFGKAQVRQSLRTKDPAEAARRYVVANAELQRRLDEAEQRVAAQAARDDISPDRAERAVRHHLAILPGAGRERYPTLTTTWWLEDTAGRLLGTGAPGLQPPDPRADDYGERMIERRGHPIAGEPWLDAVMRMPRSKWMQAVRVVLDPILEENPDIRPTDGNKALLMDAWNALVREDVRRYRQDVEAPHNEATRSRERVDLRLRQLLALWQADRQPSAQYVKEATAAVDDLISYAGDLPAVAITSTVVMNYRDAAKRLPAAMPRADRQLPFMARLEKHAGTDAPRVTATTLKKRIGAIQALLGYAFNEKMLATNAGLGVRISGYSRKGRRRRPFMDDELKALFESPLFLRPDQILKRRTAVGDPTLYWLFVLGCTSGARLEEVGQVRVADVRTDGGHLYLDITDVEAVELDDDERAAGLVEKKIKTGESDRYVPIHPIALRLGFPRYLDALRRQGSLLLFPDLARANELGKVTQEASRLLNRYVDRHAAKDRRLVFYSLRHKFKDEGRDADVPGYILDQICGHAPVSVGDGYGSGAKIATLMRHLSRLRFGMVDWAALERAAAAIDWDKVVVEVIRRTQATTPPKWTDRR